MYKDNTLQILSLVEEILRREDITGYGAIASVLIGHIEAELPLAARAYRARLVEAEFAAARARW